MGLVRIAALLAGSALAYGQEFSLSFGNVSAARAPMKVGGGLAVRAQGCAEAKLTGVIVRSAGGTRATSPLTIVSSEDKNVWAVGSMDRMTTSWLAVITAECGAARAGLIVPFDTRGLYNREKAKVLSHAPTDWEIEAALKEMD